MKIITLTRVRKNDNGTWGVLEYLYQPFALTLEPPWHDNKVNISCIPSGTYTCVPHYGRRFKGVWRVQNVPGRTGILFHPGKSLRNTRGCIVVGEQFGYAGKVPVILQSPKGFAEFMSIVRRVKSFKLTIKEV